MSQYLSGCSPEEIAEREARKTAESSADSLERIEALLMQVIGLLKDIRRCVGRIP